jgi:predicted dehydrogenase
MNLLRIAIIGCGKIADQHVLAARRVGDCEVVALCDREILMAKQLGERFGVAACFADAAEMLRSAKPDVVHITTPPQGHFALAKLCLEAGCHVYLEKPFTVTAPEAAELIGLAEGRKLKLTAGHNLQFTLEMLAMRRLVARDFLGGKPVHLESHFSYDLGDASYVGPLLGNRNHWVRQLPGQLLHNILSHGIAKLAEFLGDDVAVIASAHQSAQLQKLGGEEILDELRVLLRDANGTTAFFSFSTQLKPGRNELRICGPVNSITVDHASGTLLRHVKRSYKSYLTFFVPPLKNAKQHFQNACRNISNFLNGRLHQDSGMKELVDQFYQCIRNQSAPPLPYREILLTARIMDDIFAQIYGLKSGGTGVPPVRFETHRQDACATKTP